MSEARARALRELCEGLDRERIAYVVVSGIENFPEIRSDVDIVVRQEDFSHVDALLRRGSSLGPQFVQRFQHEVTAAYYVLACMDGSNVVTLHPDVSTDFRRANRVWMSADELLMGRHKSACGIYVPAPAVWFKYYLIKKLDKGALENLHLRTLSIAVGEEQVGCKAALDALLPRSGRKVWEMILGQRVPSKTELLEWQADLRSSPRSTPLTARLGDGALELLRIWNRLRSPTGFVLAVMGPDGAGKSTVIDAVEERLAPVFRRTQRHHLKPVEYRAGTTPVRNPYAKPARSLGGQVIKIAWFSVSYVVLWCRNILLPRRRSTLVIFDRFFHDLAADPRRYRLSRPWLLKPFLWMIPAPDLCVLLVAKPEVLVARKGEATAEHAQALLCDYQRVVQQFPDRLIVSTDRPLEAVIEEICAQVLARLRSRAAADFSRP